MSTLASRGATQVILPDAELSPLPAVALQQTLALPTQLVGSNGRLVVYAADSGLTTDFSNQGGPVLAATQLLAELSMIQLEEPGETRGVAVLPPPDWSVNPTFVDTLLAGLDTNPLLDPVTASGLFGAVQLAPLQRSIVAPPPATSNGTAGSATAAGTSGSAGATGSGSGTSGSGTSGSGTSGSGTSGSGATSPAGSGTAAPGSSTTELSATGSAAGTSTTVPSGLTGDIGSQLGSDSSLILSARRGLASMAAVLPDEAQRTASLGTDLLIAESSELSEAQRQSLLARVQGAITRIGNLITLPRSSSITLTSTRGQIPLTVLMAPSMHARVQLRLSSERLIFQSFSPSNGTCQQPTPTSEVCDLTITAQNTTLKVPVETRSSGVFPVDVSLWAPGGCSSSRMIGTLCAARRCPASG